MVNVHVVIAKHTANVYERNEEDFLSPEEICLNFVHKQLIQTKKKIDILFAICETKMGFSMVHYTQQNVHNNNKNIYSILTLYFLSIRWKRWNSLRKQIRLTKQKKRYFIRIFIV